MKNEELKNTLIAKIPPKVLSILHALEAAGFEAYVVGGAVRDLLLGREPGDFDITTNALPEQTMAVAKAAGWGVVDNLGNNFGCVVVLLQGEAFEVTTFRGEKYGQTDSHRPAEVWFCPTLQEDLSRRDFTINAMALDLQGNIHDYFGGQQDLENRILRTVGKASQRYEEDALRMLRACRFVAQLGFTYVQEEDQLPPFGAPDTPYYLPVNYKFPVGKCAGLSLERVRKELDKLLLGAYAGKGLMLLEATGLASATCQSRDHGQLTSVAILPELEHLVGLHQNARFHCYDTWEHTLQAVDNSPRELVIRWSMLLHDIGKGLPGIRVFHEDGTPGDHGHEHLSAKMATAIFARLEYPRKFSTRAIWLVARHMRFAPMMFTGRKTLLSWVRKEATYIQDFTKDPAHINFRSQQEMTEAFEQLVEVFLADMGATHAGKNPQLMADGKELGRQVVELCRNRMPVTPGDLAISGKQLLELVPRHKIRFILSYLLLRCQNGNLENEKTALLQAVTKKLQRGDLDEQ